jgi:hypothetical protein
LACHRMEGPQTFDKLAALMSEVHSKFGLEGKILLLLLLFIRPKGGPTF